MKLPPSQRLDALIEEYQHHLVHSQGVTAGTVRLHIRRVRQFLQASFRKGAIRLDQLRAADLYAYLTKLGTQYQPASLKGTASSLRSFFKFAEITKRCRPLLFKAVPSIGRRSAAKVPKFLTEGQLAAFLASLHSNRPDDLRNRAMALCLARLGLRAAEVVGMKLEDLDWREGVVRITAAKGRRHQALPLDSEVRQSLVDYLTQARPKATSRHVFLSIRPAGRPLTSSAVSRMTMRALKGAGIVAPSYGAHLFRHTTAAHLVQHGATVKEVADFLRHRSLDTTVVYTKVNFSLLESAVQPWPEVKL
jgi:site-specific recombinase XerD